MPTFECPICGKEISVRSLADAPSRPFCSPRCKAIDLGRWLTEEYRISEELPFPPPVEPPPANEQAPRPGPRPELGTDK